jgi:hypothetical protein
LDLDIRVQCNKNENYSMLGNKYELIQNKKLGESSLAHSIYFIVNELEVY